MTQNPLQGYFRRPSIYIKLPSDGNFYPAGSLEMSTNREIPVLPMTAVDEIAYRTPDALFNGQAVADVIQSCIPSIKDAWTIPSIDMDTILVAIRIASYGHELDVETKCPKCNNEASYALDLRSVLDQLKTPDYSQHITIGDLTVAFKPLTYKNLNDNNMVQFEEQKLLNILTDADMAEEKKIELVTNAFKKLSAITVSAIIQSVNYIQTPETTVQEPQFIADFLQNCERDAFNMIRDHVASLKSNTELKPLHIKCDNKECGHEYEQPFTLDMTNFFE